MLAEFSLLATMCAPLVHPQTMSAIVHQESAYNPYAININGGNKLKRQPRNRNEAIKVAQWLYESGYNFDAGLGQINVKNIAGLNLSVADLFEPCSNLKASSVVLRNCYVKASTKYKNSREALYSALSCYNTGNFSGGIKNGYVQKVVSHVTQNHSALVALSLENINFHSNTATTESPKKTSNNLITASIQNIQSKSIDSSLISLNSSNKSKKEIRVPRSYDGFDTSENESTDAYNGFSSEKPNY